MGFISADEIKDKCIGHYGILLYSIPIDEGVIPEGSIIFVYDLYDENIYSVKEFVTGKEFRIFKNLFEGIAIMTDFLDENINAITREGALYYATQIYQNTTAQLRFNDDLSFGDKFKMKINEKILRKKTLKNHSIIKGGRISLKP